jgi:hypothetical protein
MKTLITAFCLQVSGDGDPYIKLQFKTLDAMHEAHNELLTVLRQFDATPHPTPVQGEALPVVAWSFTDDPAVFAMPGSGFIHGPTKPDHAINCTPLADHAQATAGIARLQGEVERLLIKDRLASEAADESVRIELRLIAERDTLRTQLSDTTRQVGKLREALENAEQAFVRIEMQLGHRLINGEMHEAPAGSMGELSEIATDALYDLRAALNSTAQESAPAEEIGFFTQTPTHPRNYVFKADHLVEYDLIMEGRMRRGSDVHILLDGGIRSAQEYRDWNARKDQQADKE